MEGHFNFTVDENAIVMRYNEHGEAVRMYDDEDAFHSDEAEEKDEKLEDLSDEEDNDAKL